MHLLPTLPVAADGEPVAVDLAQSPAPLLFLSAADTELACLAQAAMRLGPSLPGLRLANLLQLRHPMSIDLWVEAMLPRASLVVVRLLGGAGYWRYGIEQLVGAAQTHGVALALLPGDSRPDAELRRLSTLDGAELDRLHAYLDEGGQENAARCLRRMAQLAASTPVACDLPVLPIPRAGLYRPGHPAPTLADVATGGPPFTLVLFYRALLQAGDLAPVDALLEALAARGLEPWGLFATSLREPAAAALVAGLHARRGVAGLVNLTGFALGSGQDPLRAVDRPVLQAVLAGTSHAEWLSSQRGLTPRDLAMSVALPEIDGRLLARAISFKEAGLRNAITQHAPVRHRPEPNRIAFTADLVAAWQHLAATPAGERRIALVLPNYPVRDGRMANGVGLDTPASAVRLLRALEEAGYAVTGAPATGDALMAAFARGPTNAEKGRAALASPAILPLAAYDAFFRRLPAAARDAVLARWGQPEADPWVVHGAFRLALLDLGHVVIGLQPPRGYEVDAASSHHDPALPPPHGTIAFHAWLREAFGAHALVHVGKHGHVEWLPGKALALSDACWPELLLGPLPHLYPFIVNDPGEGSQAKRRTSAVIVDHLTPPFTRAGTYGPIVELERLLDELAAALDLDPRRVPRLTREVEAAAADLGLASDLDLAALGAEGERLVRLDRHLCELKELQIRDGLHILGTAPEGAQRHGLLQALTRLPRGDGRGADASLTGALAADLGLGDVDLLAADPAAPWPGPRPAVLADATPDAWRTLGDTVERLEAVALELIAGERVAAPGWERTAAVLRGIEREVAPLLDRSAAGELGGLLAGLDGRHVPPGPSGAPTRGRLDVLPTGRNFYAVDPRLVPTPTAWRQGFAAAEAVLEEHHAAEGRYPRRLALSAWGTANMRTGGEDIAQALAHLGCRPVWERGSGRVTGTEILPLSVLGRPRVDVLLRVSGFFRDAFPDQMALLDDAIRAVAALPEPPELNPLAASARADAASLEGLGVPAPMARRRAAERIFGPPPGAYGTGLQALLDTGSWADDGHLATAFLAWGSHGYGRDRDGEPAQEALARGLGGVELIVQAQDNREHDILDSDDYWQFEGGLALAARHLTGRAPSVLHVDTSNPSRIRARPLAEEIGLIVRGRAANPRWLAGVMRHGYKGAFEIAATVDYLFAFAVTSGAVQDHHFDALHDAYLADEEVRGFLAAKNPAALREIAQRFQEAIDRGLWRPRSNSAAAELATLAIPGDLASASPEPRG